MEPVAFEPTLSEIAQNAQRNGIRDVILKVWGTPGCLNLTGGRPPFEVFPKCTHELGDDLANYGSIHAVGSEELLGWAKGFVDEHHAPPGKWNGRDLLMTSGNTDGITKAVMLLTNPADVILADSWTYPGIFASALPLGRRVEGVDNDSDGMMPDALGRTVRKLRALGQTPRFLYVTTHGQNPTSITPSVQRKKSLYLVARRCGLAIVEDDPYQFVRLEKVDQNLPLAPENMFGTSNASPSFLSMDVDGRVVRLDTFSKILAPGFRTGWVVGPANVLTKWSMLSEVFTWSLSGMQQHLLQKTLKEMGDDGLHKHIQKLQYSYAWRRDALVKACECHLTGLCRWQVPDFGMFLWLEVLGVESTTAMIDDLIKNHGVAFVPGEIFRTSKTNYRYLYSKNEVPSSAFRVSFSTISAETADESMRRLRKAILALSALPAKRKACDSDADSSFEPPPRKVRRICP